jgi:hypothetical protein
VGLLPAASGAGGHAAVTTYTVGRAGTSDSSSEVFAAANSARRLFFVSVVVACGVPGRRDKTRLMSDDQLNSTGEKKKYQKDFFV